MGEVNEVQILSFDPLQIQLPAVAPLQPMGGIVRILPPDGDLAKAWQFGITQNDNTFTMVRLVEYILRNLETLREAAR